MKRLAFCLVLAAASVAAVPAQFSVDGIYVIPRGVRAYQISSYDRTGGNEDGNRLWAYLDFNRSDRVFTIFHAAGPGRMVRFWMTGWRNPGRLRFVGDGVDLLTIQTMDLFSGDVEPFVAPVVGDEHTSSGGFFSYVPLDYEDELRIETASVSSYIQMQYYRYADTAARAQEDARAALVSEADFPPEVAANAATRVRPGTQVISASLQGAGVVERLTVTIPSDQVTGAGSMDEVLLDDIFLNITADGATEPQVSAPLSEVGGGALAGEPVASSAANVRVSGDRLSIEFLLPIPFASELSVGIENRSVDKEIDVATAIVFRSIPRIGELLEDGVIGHLYAVHRRTDRLLSGRDVELVEWTGTGRVVGVVLVASSDDPENRRILEGDDRVFIDGAPTPQIHGTGTEDFFNGGWYYKYGTFSLPTHGNPAHLVDADGDHTSQYRYLPTDSIPFAHSIRMTMEHGPSNNLAGAFSSTVFLYGVPESTLFPVDRLNADQLAAVTGGQVAVFEAPLVGTDDRAPQLRRGIVTEEGLSIELGPDVAGTDLLLRRLTDFTYANQAAEVYVNGELAGVWLTPGFVNDPGVVSTEFVVSGNVLTGSGRNELEIRPTTPWSAVDLEVFRLSSSRSASAMSANTTVLPSTGLILPVSTSSRILSNRPALSSRSPSRTAQ